MRDVALSVAREMRDREVPKNLERLAAMIRAIVERKVLA